LFKAKNLDIETGAQIAILSEEGADILGAHPGDRIEIRMGKKTSTAILNVASFIKGFTVGLTKELSKELEAKNGEECKIEVVQAPESILAIKEKLNGRRLDYKEVYSIIKDAVNGKLEKGELTAFVVALHAFGIDLEEAEYISRAMVETGEKLHLKKKRIFDKHSIGGVPGDKTTLLVVPIIAAAGLTIPKTSSRAITSAAGTADRAEVLMPVNLDSRELERVVLKTNGCIAWGGAVHLAPADDIFIKIEYPFSIDPLLLPSIMSKKKAAGSTDLVLDVPIGESVKVRNKNDAELLIKDFSSLGARLGIRVNGAITYGDQPIGHTVGTALEAKEALETIMRSKIEEDLVDKATSIAGMLLEMAGKENGKRLAKDILMKGLAEKKLREIIAEQGGDPEIKPEEIEVGNFEESLVAENEGRVLKFNNTAIAYAARIAGSPSNKKAGVVVHKKIGENVSPGEKLFTVYADSLSKAKDALNYLKMHDAILVAKGNAMLIKKIVGEGIRPSHFIFER
jgi:AMP phosphorylase